MAYPVRNDIKDRARKAKLTYRDLGVALGEPPGTVGSRLNGFTALSEEQEAKIEALLKQAEEQNG